MTAIRFVAPPPGLEPLAAFELDAVAGADGLYTLTAVERPEIRLFTLDAERHLPGYSPELPDDRAADLGISAPEEALLLVVVTPSAAGSTVNLLAPVIVNRATGAALQLVLDDDGLPVRAELAALAGAA
ncbi:flagellar assembly protein FliW [Leifsonia sp. F6_8S_P_1B]|uniref:Flagellar assembly protein FliW n=1 Tax=Leifsonia williamsii TaxID=3035919 RepID=A0ABT8K8S5_9MICO|nr:flagellar assembly protein FliW [Leifsonia williamsii]MDN4613432.1 flagellar assembly protein FliW [Leifsonia williamsii]